MRTRYLRQSRSKRGATHAYNGLDQRVIKTAPEAMIATGINFYAYDGDGKLLGEYDATGKPLQETVYLGSIPVAVVTPQAAGANLFYVYTDQINTPRIITSAATNAMVWRWDMADPFGVGSPSENPSGAGVFTYNPRMPGQLFDKETNHFYNYYRSYDPQIGRYVQSDPIGLDGGINTYAYVGGNPLAGFDSDGLACVGTGADARCTVDTFNGSAVIPGNWKDKISNLESNMTAGYLAALTNPNVQLSVETGHGVQSITAGALATRARDVALNVNSCPDPEGQNAAARSARQANRIDFYSSIFAGPKGSVVSNWGQKEVYLHEMMHQFAKIGDGTSNHNEEFLKALQPLIGPGKYYK